MLKYTLYLRRDVFMRVAVMVRKLNIQDPSTHYILGIQFNSFIQI